MTQKEMAALVGVDKAQLSRFEAGKGEMSYERIRRYVHVLNLRLAAADPGRFLVDRIANRGALLELRPSDPLETAIEAMVANDVSQLPVVSARGDGYEGVLTEPTVCEALVAEDVPSALARQVGGLGLEPLDRIRPGDPLPRVAALLASHSLVLVEDDDGRRVGFATRADLFPLLLGSVGAVDGRRPRRKR